MCDLKINVLNQFPQNKKCFLISYDLKTDICSSSNHLLDVILFRVFFPINIVNIEINKNKIKKKNKFIKYIKILKY